jgi:WD40 repeat protein
MSRASFLPLVSAVALTFIGTFGSTRAAEKTPTELYVRTDPPGATVFVDGKEAGTSPLLLEVAAGEHTVEARLAGHEPATGKVTIAEGKIGRMVLELKKLPGAAAGSTGAKAATSFRTWSAPRRRIVFPTPSAVLGVAFSPDARKAAAIDGQGIVRVLDPLSGRELVQVAAIKPEEKKRLQYPASEPRIREAAIAISPDGRKLAAAADPVVRVFDLETGIPLLTLEDKRLAGELNEIGGCISEEQERLKVVPHAQGRVYSVAFSPDGKSIATCGSHLIRPGGESVIDAEKATHGKLKIWDAATGALERDLGEHYETVRSLAFSGDGTLAAAGSFPPAWKRGIRLWDTRTGTMKKVLDAAPAVLLSSVALSPDGRLAAAGVLVGDESKDGIERTGHSCKLMVWDVMTGVQKLDAPMPGKVDSLSYSPDGKTLAAGVLGQGVLLLDPETLWTKRQKIGPAAKPSRSIQAVFSPTGDLLAIGAGDEKRGTFEVWESGEPDPAARATNPKAF